MNMQTAARTAISQCIQENSPLLDYPSSTTTSSGKLKGPLGDLGIFSNGKSVPVWKPSKTHSVDRSSDGRGSEIDMTRVCTIRFNCPSSVIHRVWFDQHHQRNTWDTRTCLDSTKKATYPAEKNELSPLNLFWLISQPKPLISPRDFLYAYKEIPYEGKGRLYAGSSVDHVDGVELAEFESENKDAVRAWLQGMCRVKEVGKNTCDVTYCVRVKPSGSLPKSVALLVSNELVYTLFNLRQKAESVWSARKAKMRLKKKNKASSSTSKL